MKIIKHDLILKKDTTFKESIKVEGDIKGNYNLTVWGDIDAWDIDAGDINAGNIDAGNIICASRTKKSKKAKTICRLYVKNRSKLVRKEREE